MAESTVGASNLNVDVTSPVYQAYQILRWAFVAAPVIAGADKFANVLVHWSIYLTPLVPRLTGIPAQTFMYVVGIVEVLAGVFVAIKPRYAAYVVAVWLWGIIINLL